MESIVHAAGLRKSYGSLEVVRGIDFAVRPGECFGVLGPNGAGKTTTIGMTICFLPVGGGELSVFGLDVRTSGREIKARLGVVPQEDDLDPDLSVLENLLVYARYFGIPKAEARRRAAELIAFMQLESKTGGKISQLSGGLKRRLTIARALINRPAFLVLDEPTTGLDPQARLAIWNKLRALKSQGTTMLLTTHYMEEAERLCDRLIVMDHGTILAAGSPAELIARHVGAEALEFREENPALVERLRGAGFTVESAGDHFLVFPRAGEREALLALAAPAQPYLQRMANLEDVFVRLTGRELRE
jgi:lipooligosaccharide transport system ATP-binding protein